MNVYVVSRIDASHESVLLGVACSVEAAKRVADKDCARAKAPALEWSEWRIGPHDEVEAPEIQGAPGADWTAWAPCRYCITMFEIAEEA